MRLPLVRRSTHERKLGELATARAKIKEQSQHLARIGHARDQAYRDAARVLHEMRLYAFQIHQHREHVVISARVAHPLLVEGYRRSGALREMLSYMLEFEFERSDAGRDVRTMRPL